MKDKDYNSKEYAEKMLKKLLRQGKYKCYTILRHVSKSGMSCKIDVYTIIKNEPVYLSGYISHLTGITRDKKTGSLKVSGCGMDMGFHVVYNLSMALYCKRKYNHDLAYKLNQTWI